MKYIIGNWKSNKKEKDIREWFEIIAKSFQENKKYNLNNLELVVCPPFIYLPLSKELRDKYKIPIQLGAQDISPFDAGAYTGEINADMLVEFAKCVIIGHSERRNYFEEKDEILAKKVIQAKERKLISIFCIQGTATFIPCGVDIVAFEPIKSIGTGDPENPKTANETAMMVRNSGKIGKVIYGGSVKPDNINSYLREKYIDGVLPGGASLDPHIFWEMIANAASL